MPAATRWPSFCDHRRASCSSDQTAQAPLDAIKQSDAAKMMNVGVRSVGKRAIRGA
jgi:hypothetical protein